MESARPGRFHQGVPPLMPSCRAPRQPLAGALVSLEAAVPEVLFDGMRRFLQKHPDWDQYQVITSALAVFLFQNGSDHGSVSQHYLEVLFPGS